MQWTTLMKKEMLQFWRNKQIIWVPLVMAILAVMDPITYYFLPEILELSGGLPEGAVFEIPELTANDSFLLGVESLNFMGVMLLLLISMGAIAAERKSGVAEMMYTKPIHPFSYMMSKWLALLIVAAVALFTALAFNWYYTNVLYGELEFFVMIKTFGFYMVWLMFIVAVAIFFNAFLSKPGLVFASAAGVIFVMNLIDTFLGHKLTYFPNRLTSHLEEMLYSQKVPGELYMTAGVILITVCVLLGGSTVIFKNKKI